MPFTRANLRMPNEVNSPGRRQSFRHAERMADTGAPAGVAGLGEGSLPTDHRMR